VQNKGLKTPLEDQLDREPGVSAKRDTDLVGGRALSAEGLVLSLISGGVTRQLRTDHNSRAPQTSPNDVSEHLQSAKG